MTVQGPLKEQQPDGMSHRGVGLGPGGAGSAGPGAQVTDVVELESQRGSLWSRRSVAEGLGPWDDDWRRVLRGVGEDVRRRGTAL